MLTLFYSPGSCALGIHLLLEETGRPYRLNKVDLSKGAQFEPDYRAINPKSKVPALQREDGSILTEFPAIAYWLAATTPGKHLLPSDPEAGARVFEALDYVVATLHMQGFTRIWKPGAFSPNEADHEAVRNQGRAVCEKGLATLDRALEGRDYVAATFSIADAALFYFEFWLATRIAMPMPERVQAHYQRVLARPSARRALEMEELRA